MVKFFKINIINNSIAINSIWALSGSLINRGINFFAISFIAKQLGPKLFGEYNVVQTTIGLFGTVSGLGLGLAATKLIAEWRTKEKNTLGEIIGNLYLISILISLIVFLIFFILSTWVSIEILENQSLIILFKITAAIVVFDSINGVQNGILSGYEKFKVIAIINLITGLITAILLITGTLYYNILGLTFSLLIVRLLTVLITSIYIKDILILEETSVRIKFKKEVLKSIFSISIPSFLSSMATSPVNWIATTIFVNQPYGYSSLGTFNVVNQLRQLVLFLPDSAGKVSIPKLANAYGNNEEKRFKKILIATIISNIIFSTIPAAILFTLSYFFKNYIGPQYIIDDMLITIILLTGISIAITNAIGYIFICANMVWYDFYLRIFWSLSLLLIMSTYGKYNGAYGYAISTLSSYIVLLLTQFTILLTKLLKK